MVWPAEWCVGLVVPLWKKKGSKKVKGNWRGITLLSVGSKLIARVVATRLRSFLMDIWVTTSLASDKVRELTMPFRSRDDWWRRLPLVGMPQ